MTRDDALDILWSSMMVSLPLGAELPNTDEDRSTAKLLLSSFVLALQTLGVGTDEMLATQSRYMDHLRAANTIHAVASPRDGGDSA